MSCQPTTRAQEDPYAFTESAPLQANSLAYANHSSVVSATGGVSANNATITTSAVSSGGSLLLAPATAGGGTTPKDKNYFIATSNAPATFKVRYNGVVTPSATTVLKASGTTATTVATTIPVFTKPLQIKQQVPQASSQPTTVTVGKLIKKVIPQQKSPMITTVVAGGAKLITRLQQQNPNLSGQQLQPVLSTAGGSVLKFIKIPPHQLAKATAAGGSIPQGSFIQVTTTADGGRKLVATSGNSVAVNPNISVTSGITKVAAGAPTTTIRNATGVTVVPALPTAAAAKIRLIQPQSQGKIFLHAPNSTGSVATHISNPISIAALRNSLVKQQQVVAQKLSIPQQPAGLPVVKPQQTLQQPLQQKQLQQQQTQPQHPQKQLILQQQQQQQQVLKQQPSQQPKQPAQQSPVVQKTLQQQALLKSSLQPVLKALPSPQLQLVQKSDSTESIQKLLKQGQSVPYTLQQSSPQQTSSQQQIVVQKTTPFQSNSQTQSLLLQQQQLTHKPTPSANTSSTTVKVQPQSLLLQQQRKQQQLIAAAANKPPRTVLVQKPIATHTPVSLLAQPLPVSTSNGSLLLKTNDTSSLNAIATTGNIVNVGKPLTIDNVRRSSNQQSLLVGASIENASKSLTTTRDQTVAVNSVDNANRTTLVTIGAKSTTVAAGKKETNTPSSVVEDSTKEQPTDSPVKPVIAQLNANGKVRQTPGRKPGTAGRAMGKQLKGTKRSYSLSSEEQPPKLGETSPILGNTVTSAIPLSSNSVSRIVDSSTPVSPTVNTVKLENDCDIKQEVDSADVKPPRPKCVSNGVPGAIVVPIKRPKIKEWHAPGAYLFDLKDPGDESDDDAFEEYPNTLSFWYEESIAISVPDSTTSWGGNPIQPIRGSSSIHGGARAGKNKQAGRMNNGKFQIRMLTRDERLELKKAYLQRRAVQCRNGLRIRNLAVSTAKRRLESMAMIVKKLEKRHMKALEKESEKAQCVYQGCSRAALELASHCYEHITENKEQCLFQRCTAKFSDNSQCRVPVFDISHELVLCKEHAWKHDNHDKMSQEVKLQKKSPSSSLLSSTYATTTMPVASPGIALGRKKSKPNPQTVTVVARPQKRAKKKKKLTPLQQQMLLHQQQYQQRFVTHQQQVKSASLACAQQRPVPKKAPAQQQPQVQKSLLHSSHGNGKVPEQDKTVSVLQKTTPLSAHLGSRSHLTNGTKNPTPKITLHSGVAQTATQRNRNVHIPHNSANHPRSITGTVVYGGQHNNSTVQIVEQLQSEPKQPQLPQQQQQQHFSNGLQTIPAMHNAPSTTQDMLTICENSSAYASSEDTGVGGLSESELLATQDVIEEIIPFEFGNLLNTNMLSHLPQEALNELLFLGNVPAEDDTGDSHESCPREVEDDIERALEHVKSLDDMTVEPSSLLGDFLDNVDDEMLDGSDICTTEQMLHSPNKSNDIRGMVHT